MDDIDRNSVNERKKFKREKMSVKRNAAYVVHLQCEIPVVPIVIPMSRRPYGCWHWSAAGEKLLCRLRSGLRSVAEPTGEDHFHCRSTWGHLKDIRTSTNPLTGTYTQASVRDCCHMVKSPQAPLTSDNMTFWLSHCPQCYSHWDAKVHTVKSGCQEFSKKKLQKNRDVCFCLQSPGCCLFQSTPSSGDDCRRKFHS